MPGAGVGRNGESMFKGYRDSVSLDEKVLEMMAVMVAQQYECS